MSDVNTGSVVNATASTNSDNADAPFVQYKVPFGVAALRYLKGFSSKGRSSRSDFWYGLLFGFVLDLGVDGVIGDTAIYVVFAIAFFVLDVYLWWRRMQDLGRSGWWCLVPFYNLYLAAQPSQPTDNKFGPVPNTQPFAINKKANNIAIGVMAVSLMLAFVGGCLGGDSAEDAFLEFAESVVEKDQTKFYARAYFEGVDSEKFEANSDLANMIFEKFAKEFCDEKMMRLMKNPDVLDVVDDGEDVYVKFAPSDESMKSRFAAEGLSGMMVKAVETDEGWKIAFDAMRPIFASKEEVAEGKRQVEREEDAARKQAAAIAAEKAVEDLKLATLKGRRLYVAMVKANTDREAAGLVSVFPHLTEDDGLDTTDKEDIAGKKFDSACAYFSALFDVGNSKKGDWQPYVEGLDLGCLALCGEECKSDYLMKNQVNWMVMAGITSEMDDNMPILISANIEPSYLTFKSGRKSFANDGRLIPIGRAANRYGDASWWNDAIVVVRKGGSAEVIKRPDCTLKAIFGSDEISLQNDIKCLAP